MCDAGAVEARLVSPKQSMSMQMSQVNIRVYLFKVRRAFRLSVARLRISPDHRRMRRRPQARAAQLQGGGAWRRDFVLAE